MPIKTERKRLILIVLIFVFLAGLLGVFWNRNSDKFTEGNEIKAAINKGVVRSSDGRKVN